jgi:hypothetical protein
MFCYLLVHNQQFLGNTHIIRNLKCIYQCFKRHLFALKNALISFFTSFIVSERYKKTYPKNIMLEVNLRSKCFNQNVQTIWSQHIFDQ